MTSCPFSENGMPIKGWPKSLLGGGACSICSAILGIFYLLCPSKYSIGSCHLPCKSPCSTRYEWLCCKNAGYSTKVIRILVRISEGTPVVEPFCNRRVLIVRQPAFQAGCHESSFHLLPNRCLCNLPQRSFRL